MRKEKLLNTLLYCSIRSQSTNDIFDQILQICSNSKKSRNIQITENLRLRLSSFCDQTSTRQNRDIKELLFQFLPGTAREL